MKTKLLRKIKMKNNRTAYEAALHLLKYRDQSTYELRQKLKLRRYSEKDVEECISKLTHYNYVNDDDLAKKIFQDYKNRKIYGDKYIHEKMMSKGLATNQHLTYDDEVAAAMHVMQNKIKLIPEFKSNYKRAAALLARRGFPAPVIRFILEKLHISDF